jgi:hypothetical protein
MTKLTIALLLMACLIALPHGATAQTNSSTITLTNLPVTTTTGTAAGTLSGTLDILRFFTQNGQLMAAGLLNGTLTNLAGATTNIVNQLVNVPITNVAGSCTILTLDLGPLHLDLLGLVVDLSAVHLAITAQQGAGNLLGNLLCAVANLLNNNAPLAGITNVLNQLLWII